MSKKGEIEHLKAQLSHSEHLRKQALDSKAYHEGVAAGLRSRLEKLEEDNENLHETLAEQVRLRRVAEHNLRHAEFRVRQFRAALDGAKWMKEKADLTARVYREERDKARQDLDLIESHVSEVYSEITDGRISKVNTHSRDVIAEYEEVLQKYIREAIDEEHDVILGQVRDMKLKHPISANNIVFNASCDRIADRLDQEWHEEPVFAVWESWPSEECNPPFDNCHCDLCEGLREEDKLTTHCGEVQKL